MNKHPMHHPHHAFAERRSSCEATETESIPFPKITVLGIGNTLLRDEGAGVHAMRQFELETGTQTGVEFLDGGTLSFALAGAISETDYLIVMDAAELGTTPGTISVYCDEEMDHFLGTNRKHSVHEVGLLDLLAVTHLTGRLPPRRALIGIQPEILDWGENLSPAVQAALPSACALARELIQTWWKGEDNER